MIEDEFRSKNRTDKSDIGDYPYVQVFETSAGHEVHFDNTPGKERIYIAHSSGTYQEWSADGKVTSYTVGDSKHYGKGGVTMTIDENNDLKISGHNRILVGGGAHIEVAGDAGIAVGGDTMLMSMGNLNAHVNNIYLGAKGNMNFNISGEINMKAAGNMNLKASNINLN